MAFKILQDLTMEIRKGNTGVIQISGLPNAYNGGTARLTIKANAAAPDIAAPIYKTAIIENNGFGFHITAQESDGLLTANGKSSVYKWGIQLETASGDVVVNLVPPDNSKIPNCIVLQGIGGKN